MRGEAEEQRANGRITEGVERQADGVQLEANVDIEPLGIKHVRISREMRHARRRRQATQHDASHTRVECKGAAVCTYAYTNLPAPRHATRPSP